MAEKLIALVLAGDRPVHRLKNLRALTVISTGSSSTGSFEIPATEKHLLCHELGYYDESKDKHVQVIAQEDGNFKVQGYDFEPRGNNLLVHHAEYRDCGIRDVFDQKEWIVRINEFLDNKTVAGMEDKKWFDLYMDLSHIPFYETPNVAHIQNAKLQDKNQVKINYHLNGKSYVVLLNRATATMTAVKDCPKLFRELLLNWIETGQLVIGGAIYSI